MGNRVNTTSRVRVTLEYDREKKTYTSQYVYTSCDMIREIQDKQLVVRVGQIFVARKGKLHDLLYTLLDLARKNPEHFMKSSINYLESDWLVV